VRENSNIAGLSVLMNNKNKNKDFSTPKPRQLFSRFLFGIKQNNYSTDTTIQHV
jgi:hypothetical protein